MNLLLTDLNKYFSEKKNILKNKLKFCKLTVKKNCLWKQKENQQKSCSCALKQK